MRIPPKLCSRRGRRSHPHPWRTPCRTCSRCRKSLVGELLSPLIPNAAMVLTDAAPTNLSSPGANGAIAEDRPQRKLIVARELRLRDLHARMRSRPVRDTPQGLREWLRLYCAGQEHEVFIVVYLDAYHHVVEAAQLFRCTRTQTSVDPAFDGCREHRGRSSFRPSSRSIRIA